MPLSRCGYRWLLLAVVLCSSAELQAQPLAAHPAPLRMPVDVDPCVTVDTASFQRQLAIELEAAAQARALVRAQNRMRITLGCVGEQISVAITDAVARRTWRRKVELHGVDPRAQTRLLALSVAELLLASRLELHMDAVARRRERRHARARPSIPVASEPERTQEVGSANRPSDTQVAAATEPEPDAEEDLEPEDTAQTPPAASDDAPSSKAQPAASEPDEETAREAEPEPVRMPEPEPAPEQPEPRPPRAVPLLQLGAAADALAFSSSFALLPGGELRVSVPLSAAWALRIAAQAGHGRLRGSVSTPVGQKDSRVRVTAGSLGLALHALTRTGDLELSLGAGARVGLARLVGEATDLESVSAFAPWAGPLLSPSVRYHVSAVTAVTLSVEVGLMAVRVRALGPENVPVTELRGLWMMLSLGLDLAFVP